jgi:hypothetical protein
MRRSRLPFYQWLFLAAVIVVLADLVVLPSVLARPIDSLTVYYSLATFAGALTLAALVELRLVGLDKKLDKILEAQRKANDSV